MKLNHNQYEMVSAMIRNRLLDASRKEKEELGEQVRSMMRSECESQIKATKTKHRVELNRIKKLDAMRDDIEDQIRALSDKRNEIRKKIDAICRELAIKGLVRHSDHSEWQVETMEKSEALIKAEKRLSELNNQSQVYRKLEEIMVAIVLLDSPQVVAFLKEQGIELSIPTLEQ